MISVLSEVDTAVDTVDKFDGVGEVGRGGGAWGDRERDMKFAILDRRDGDGEGSLAGGGGDGASN